MIMPLPPDNEAVESSGLGAGLVEESGAVLLDVAAFELIASRPPDSRRFLLERAERPGPRSEQSSCVIHVASNLISGIGAAMAGGANGACAGSAVDSAELAAEDEGADSESVRTDDAASEEESTRGADEALA
jgi:hypothetical protein